MEEKKHVRARNFAGARGGGGGVSIRAVFAEQRGKSSGRDFLKRDPHAPEILHCLDECLSHARMGFLRAAHDGKLFRPGEALMAVVTIKPDAEQAGLSLRRRFHERVDAVPHRRDGKGERHTLTVLRAVA